MEQDAIWVCRVFDNLMKLLTLSPHLKDDLQFTKCAIVTLLNGK